MLMTLYVGHIHRSYLMTRVSTFDANQFLTAGCVFFDLVKLLCVLTGLVQTFEILAI